MINRSYLPHLLAIHLESASVYTTVEKSENTALFLRPLCLPSTLIRHENEAFWKCSSNRKNSKHGLCFCVWTKSILKTELYDFPARGFLKKNPKCDRSSFLTPILRNTIFLSPWRYLPVTHAIPSGKLHIMTHWIVRSLFNFWIILMWQPPFETLRANIFFYGATNQPSPSRHEIIYDSNFIDLRALITNRKTGEIELLTCVTIFSSRFSQSIIHIWRPT